jgi:DNA-directed RNA polymerase subunit K/omega
MDESNVELEPAAESATPAPRQKALPIESRFLYVDIAAMRAKQLRRGATPRLSEDDPEHDPHRTPPHKPERVAMEEVRRGLVPYDIGHNRPSK